MEFRKVRHMVDKILKLIKSLVFRIHILKIVSIVLFLVICFRLYSIQVTYSPDYTNYIERSTTVELQKNVPRGVIYDRNFDVLVDNEAVNTITYQLYSDVSKSQMKDIASQLANLIEVDFSKLTSRDLKDLYLEVFKEEANELVTAKEIKELDDNEIYQLQLSRITDEMLEKLSDHDKETQAIYINMNKGTNLTSNIIKKGATQDEIAIVSEHLESLPGVNTDVDWDRTYPSVAGISPIYGRVSSYEQGLPANLSGYYKAHDYQSNDRVGLSQLELYYEALLRGSKSQYVLKNENEVSNYQEIYEGQRGYELVLSLDAELQAALNKIVEDELIAAKTNRPVATQYLREAYVVMLNPNTGEVLSMTGKVIEYNEETKQYEIYDNSLGTIQNAFTMGSVVKGASLLAGYHYGVTDINQYITDGPLSFKGGLIKKSWKTLGYINDSDALKFSSNVYFMLQTIRLGGGTYVPGGPLVLDVSAFDQYREFFNQFGLGVSTGIDLPNESIGLIETNKTSGKLLDFSIGQADIYTTMQLAQYVSTIATSGRRYAPQIVKDVYLPSNEEVDGKQLVKSFEPKLLNIVQMDQKYYDRVHEGFKRALQESGGTGYSVFYKADFNPAGKTGTAQEYLRDTETGRYVKDENGDFIEVYNRTLIAYAPADNPEVAIAVVIPQAELPTQSDASSLNIGYEALKAYFDLNKQRIQTTPTPQNQDSIPVGETEGGAETDQVEETPTQDQPSTPNISED